MTTFVFANNISTQLASPVSSSDTTITIASTVGFPSSIPSGSVLEVTLNDQATHTVFEILYATAITGSTLTVLRAQEGTTALSWSTGDIVFSGPTAGQMQSFSSPNLAAYSLFGNPAASTAPAEAVTLGAGLVFSGTTLKVSPTTLNLTLDVTGSASLDGSSSVNLAATIGAGTVTTAKMAALASHTLIANPTGSSAVPQAVTLANGLAFSGTSLGMGGITPTSVTVTSGNITTGSGTVSGGTVTSSGAVNAGANFTATTSAVNLNTTGAGTVNLRPNGQGSSTGQLTVASTGNVVASGTITPGSDERIKTHIVPITGALDIVRTALVGVEYDRVDQDMAHDAGFIAQRVKQHLPHLVPITETHGFTDFHSMNYNGAVAYLSAAIVELHDIVKQQQNMIEAMTSKEG